MTLAVLALGLLTVGFVVDLAGRGRSTALVLAVLGAVAAGCGLLLVAGARAVTGLTSSAGMGWLLSGVAVRPSTVDGLVLDRLAGLFLLIVFATALPATLVVASWLRMDPSRARSLPAALCLMLAASALVILAGNVFLLYLAWELVTVSFFWLASLQRRRSGRVTSGVVTVGFGKVSGAALLLGLLLLAGSTDSLDLTALGQAPRGIVHAAAYSLLVLAFAIKVGLAPVQVWLPRGYGASPGPARALMAGATVNVGFYGLWRTLQLLGAPPGWLAVVLLLLGGLTGLLGIAHATVQTQLTGVVAYSSVENAGLIFTAYAIALVGSVTGMVQLVAAGLLAATLQVIAHAVAKSLLFSAAGVVESQLGSDDIDQLRGVSRLLPWSGSGLAVGALTMAGLPPLALFVSEWFLLEALMQQFRVGRLIYAIPMALAGALVALTAGFAGVAFVRLAAFTAWGHSGPAHRSVPSDIGAAGKVGIGALATSCFALAALAPIEIRVISAGLSDVVPAEVTRSAVASPWVLGPVYREFSVLSPSWLAIELPLMFALVAATTLALTRGGMLRVRRVDPWLSATGGVEGADEYTPFGYANPTRKVLANILLSRSELRTLEAETGGRVGDERLGSAGAHLGYTVDVVEVTEAYLYRPLVRPILRFAALARRLQSGRLDAYLLYMLVALVAVLAVVTALA